MADLRRARRNAEKTARAALNGTLVDSAGELGAALASQLEAHRNVDAVRDHAKALVEAARADGRALITAAQADADQADTMYAAAWTAGKAAGWPPAQLRAMGYPKPPARRPTPTGAVLAAVNNPSPPPPP